MSSLSFIMDIHIYKGRIATGAQFIANAEKKDWIYKTFNAYVTEMESAAVRAGSRFK
jgi:adenosylhomocysteine nucleosidase